MSNDSFEVTDSALAKIHELLSVEENFSLVLRVYVVGGGCSGFQYGFAFEKSKQDDDILIINDHKNVHISIVIDPFSFPYLESAKLDYVENLNGAQFMITNPNAVTTCGCGSSFSV